MNIKKTVIIMMAGAMLMMSAGCDPQTEKGSQEPSSSSVSSSGGSSAPSNSAQKPSAGKTSGGQQQAEVKKLQIDVYYPNEDGTRLIKAPREIEVTPYKDKYTAAVEMQMRAPKEKNLIDIFPINAKLRGVKVEGSRAVVDFDGSLAKGFVGGSTGEEMLIGSVVNTLTNFPEIKEVLFLIDGKPTETLAGHMDLTMPVQRMTGLLK